MSTPKTRTPSAQSRLLYLLPLAFFIALALIFLMRLQSGTNPEYIPSALVGKPAPEFALPALEGAGVPGLTRADLDGGVTLVNVFASWCGPCRVEHPILERLATDDRFALVGINYKDEPGNALGFLEELGNPYTKIGTDERGRIAIDWGVYGLPETFIVGADGTVLFKFIGPLTEKALEARFMPELDKALTEKALAVAR